MKKNKNRTLNHQSQPKQLNLGNARLCLDCEALFGKGRFDCPQCGSSSWLHIGRIIPSLKNEPAVKYAEPKVLDAVQEMRLRKRLSAMHFKRFRRSLAALLRFKKIEAGV